MITSNTSKIKISGWHCDIRQSSHEPHEINLLKILEWTPQWGKQRWRPKWQKPEDLKEILEFLNLQELQRTLNKRFSTMFTVKFFG